MHFETEHLFFSDSPQYQGTE
jgi:hypothetical protein